MTCNGFVQSIFKKSVWGLCLSFFCFSVVEAQQVSLSSVDELLERASKALQEQNYKGRFTYEFGTTLETLEVVHVVKDGVEYERITHLNGPEREFVRRGREYNCVSAGGFLLRGGLLQHPQGAISLAQSYHFYVRGKERIAGRDAEVIQIVPKDEHRYGMTLAMDKASGLPLMSLTTVSNKSAIERFQFTDLDVGPDIQVDDASPVGARHARLDGSKLPCTKSAPTPSLWQASWLPSGFVVTYVSSMAEEEVLTYTDGIASFTLFIKTAVNPRSFKQGVAIRGATTAVMALVPQGQASVGVVLVGEIPVTTAQQIIMSVSAASRVN